jgi:hypothetical protein
MTMRDVIGDVSALVGEQKTSRLRSLRRDRSPLHWEHPHALHMPSFQAHQALQALSPLLYVHRRWGRDGSQADLASPGFAFIARIGTATRAVLSCTIRRRYPHPFCSAFT